MTARRGTTCIDMKNTETEMKLMADDAEGMLKSQIAMIPVNQPPKGGFSIAEMLRRKPLVEKLEAAKKDDEIHFTATEIVLLKELWDAKTDWPIMADCIVDLAQEINEMATKAPEETR